MTSARGVCVDDQMDTQPRGHLRDERNRAFYIGCHCSAANRPIVMDNDDVGHFVRDLDISLGSRVADA